MTQTLLSIIPVSYTHLVNNPQFNGKVKAVAYVWSGGMEGGNAVVDVLSGKETPSGKLPDTIAENLEDYPSYENFGDPLKNLYKEDIYVGYRYFETFAPEKVVYEFGFGQSYTCLLYTSRCV